MSRLEENLKELGYELNMFGFYSKQDIKILAIKNKIFNNNCYVEAIKEIKNRNDIQALKDSIEDYDNQLRIMKKDLEILKGVDVDE